MRESRWRVRFQGEYDFLFRAAEARSDVGRLPAESVQKDGGARLEIPPQAESLLHGFGVPEEERLVGTVIPLGPSRDNEGSVAAVLSKQPNPVVQGQIRNVLRFCF